MESFVSSLLTSINEIEFQAGGGQLEGDLLPSMGMALRKIPGRTQVFVLNASEKSWQVWEDDDENLMLSPGIHFTQRDARTVRQI